MGDATSDSSIRHSLVDDFPGEALGQGVGNRCKHRLSRDGSLSPRISAAFILQPAFARFGSWNSRRGCLWVASRNARSHAASGSFTDLRRWHEQLPEPRYAALCHVRLLRRVQVVDRMAGKK